MKEAAVYRARSQRSFMKIAAVLVARWGGESRRMGQGQINTFVSRKTALVFNSELLRKLEPTEISVSARTDPVWRPADVQFVADDRPSRGPLSGLAVSLAKVCTKHLLALAIDMPFITEEYLKFLCTQIEPDRGVIAKIDDRFEPLATIYPHEALPNVKSALSGEDFSLQTLAGRLAAEGKLRWYPLRRRKEICFGM